MQVMRETDKKLAGMAARLRLAYMRDNMEALVNEATSAKMTPREVLEYCLGKEIDQRETNRVRLATMAAHFPRICTLESYDMDAQPALDPGIIRELKKMEWIDTGENVMFFGPPGVGKSHLAIGFGRKAIQHGKSVRFIGADDLATALTKADSMGLLAEKMSQFSKPDLLIIDELGYVPFDPHATYLFFQLVCRRYEKKSMIITSNKTVLDWGRTFADPTLATSILDRLMHHCTPVTIMGESYRLKSNKIRSLINKTA